MNFYGLISFDFFKENKAFLTKYFSQHLLLISYLSGYQHLTFTSGD